MHFNCGHGQQQPTSRAKEGYVVEMCPDQQMVMVAAKDELQLLQV